MMNTQGEGMTLSSKQSRLQVVSDELAKQSRRADELASLLWSVVGRLSTPTPPLKDEECEMSGGHLGALEDTRIRFSSALAEISNAIDQLNDLI